MAGTPATSPFAKTEFVDINESYSKEGLITGMQLPDGRILLNFDHNTKTSVVAEIAKLIGAKVVVVKGTWTFTPAVEEDDDE